MYKKWFSNKMRQPIVATENNEDNEQGQSIVILAFVFIGLLAFVGLAVDVGFVFARSTQLQAAVDAGALAGVTELSEGDLIDADNRAAQFLRANGVPISVTQTFLSDTGNTPLNATEYTITATWPVDLFFLPVIGLDVVNVTKSATAAYFPLADVFTARRSEYGFVDTANQSVFGPRICTAFGDPFSPLTSDFEPGFYTWQYRIYIPPDYNHDVVRVELFDPDSINIAENSHNVSFSATAIQYSIDNDPEDARRFVPAGTTLTCNNNAQGDQPHQQFQPCVIETGELAILDEDNTISIDQINPYWFVRVDENRGAGNNDGNDTCARPGNYTARFNTQTVYGLSYFAQGSDGNIERIAIASYTGQVGDGGRDTGDHQTDLRWISPGGAQSYDQPVPVPTDFGSFEVNLTLDTPDILTDPSTGARYIYLDITTISGASENGYQIWAGPPNPGIASDVNLRNIQLVNNPGSNFSEGVIVYAMGNLPMNSIFPQPVDIPLIYVGPEMAGQRIFLSLFDTDSGTDPPIAFFFNSIGFTPTTGNTVGVDWDATDWGFLFGDNTDPETERCFHVSNNNCNDQWIDPPYALTVPGDLSRCDYGVLDALANNPGTGSVEYREYLMNNCTPFYGGRLYSRYASNFADTYVWQIRLEGIPYLVR
jgi:hypothetical protein